MNQSLPLLTPLRGIAALMVVLFHARLLVTVHREDVDNNSSGSG